MIERGGTDGQQVSWRWVVGCLLLGAAGTGAAFIAESVWGWVGTSPAALLEFGSALFIAAVLFFVQRRFLREVRGETRALEQRFDARTSELESRLDRLTESTAEAVGQRHSSQDDALAKLGDDVTFETVTSVLQEAERLNAIDPLLFRVRASPRLDGPRMRFSWLERSSSKREFILKLSSPDPRVASALGRDSIIWRPHQPAPAVGDAVVLMLERAGMPHDPETFDWGLTIASLQRSLRVAIAARRGDPGAPRLQGRLIELVNDDWMLTDAGIECPTRSFLLDEARFPTKPKLPRSRGQDTQPTLELDPPPWVAGDFWAQLLRLGQLIFPIEPRSVMQDLGWPGRRRHWDEIGGGVGGTAP